MEAAITFLCEISSLITEAKLPMCRKKSIKYPFSSVSLQYGDRDKIMRRNWLKIKLSIKFVMRTVSNGNFPLLKYPAIFFPVNFIRMLNLTEMPIFFLSISRYVFVRMG